MTCLTTLEICAGGGGQALGLEQAGFLTAAALDIDPDACDTLRLNRPHWTVIERDIREFDGTPYCMGIDLLAGGVPCQPFSVGGKQLGRYDERDLFPEALRLVREIRPLAVMLENVSALAQRQFHGYRTQIIEELWEQGYGAWWQMANACDYGVPQLRPRFVLVAVRMGWYQQFRWPDPPGAQVLSVGAALGSLMGANDWEGAPAWAAGASEIAPTIVGGSKKHGGPDLGPTRARQAWARLGVEGRSIAEEAPGPGFRGMPRLTVPMVARLQGFPDDWKFSGRKTAAYRQVGNAFPPPVARAIGEAIYAAIRPR